MKNLKSIDFYKTRVRTLGKDANRLFDEASSAVKTRYNRATGRRLHVGVAGLSGAGKSTFLTSLIALIETHESAKLSAFSAALEGRLGKVHRLSGTDNRVQFPITEQLERFAQGEYPLATVGPSEIAFEIEFTKRNGSKRKLELILSDFPGEWLLDVAMLSMTFSEWNHWQSKLWRARAFESFDAVFNSQQLNRLIEAGEQDTLSRRLQEILVDYRLDHKAAILVPGQLAVPASSALVDSAIPCIDWKPGVLPELDAFLEQRYQDYLSHCVRPFFEEYVACIDRQLVLLDVHKVVNGGALYESEVSEALALVLGQVRYGERTPLLSLLRPSVDKVMFVATKADLVLPEDHDAMRHLLGSVCDDAIRYANSLGAAVSVEAIAAMCSAKYVRKEGVLYLEGTDKAGRVYHFHNPELIKSSQVNYEGHRRWELPSLTPISESGVPKHQRMDTVLDQILGDFLS